MSESEIKENYYLIVSFERAVIALIMIVSLSLNLYCII